MTLIAVPFVYSSIALNDIKMAVSAICLFVLFVRFVPKGLSIDVLRLFDTTVAQSAIGYGFLILCIQRPRGVNKMAGIACSCVCFKMFLITDVGVTRGAFQCNIAGQFGQVRLMLKGDALFVLHCLR